jgi:cobalt-zinc-cadmium efflux system protein
LVSLAIALIVIVATWGLLKDSVALALQAVPREVDVQDVGKWLSSLPGVADVHHLHVWAMSTTENALTAHLVYPGFPGDECLHGICAELRAHHAIAHATIQVETGEAGAGCVAKARGAHAADHIAIGLSFSPPAGPAAESDAEPRSRQAR